MKAKPEATLKQILAQVRTQLWKCEFNGAMPDELAYEKLIMMVTDAMLKKNLLKK